MTESGLVKCLDQLAEATAQWLQVAAAAAPAAAQPTSDTPSLELLQFQAATLLYIQVG
jgi:hypothetical protein